jgi:antitoxin YefM
MARIVPVTQARARLAELLDDVQSGHEPLVITRNGRSAAVLVSPEEWDAIEETLGTLQDEETRSDLRESDKDVKAGRLFGLEDVRRGLA